MSEDSPHAKGQSTASANGAPQGAIEQEREKAARETEGAKKERRRPRRRASAWPDRASPRAINSIGATRTPSAILDRDKPDRGWASERPSAGAADLDSAVADHIRARYIQNRRRFHFPDGDPAFHVRAHRTTTQSESPQVIRDILEIEHARANGARLVVRGTKAFRAEAWSQAQLMGIEIRGYRPSELERAKIAREIEQRRSRTASDTTPEASARETNTSTPRAPDPTPTRTRERSTPLEGRVYQGRLLEHGPAHYQQDRHAEMSYYAKLAMPEGERVLWGKDLRRAITQSLSGVKVGDEVGIQRTGDRPVTAPARRLNDPEAPTRQAESRWLVEKADFRREREHVAQLVRDPTVKPKDAVARHPQLMATYLELHASRLLAQQRYSHEIDRERFVSRIRNALADEIARGEPFSVPRVKSKEPKTSKQEPAHRQAREQDHVRA
jgi:putative DNA primase/helicase